MMSPVAMSIAILTVMLWILWSDTIRRRRPSQVLFTVRIALFLIVSGVMIVNLVRYPQFFPGSSKVLAILVVIVGIAGATHFGRRVVKRI